MDDPADPEDAGVGDMSAGGAVGSGTPAGQCLKSC
jgi:hypothetical protein